MLKSGFNKFSTKIDRNAILLLQEMRGKWQKFQQIVISNFGSTNGSLLKRESSYKIGGVEIMMLGKRQKRSPNPTEPFKDTQWRKSNQTQPVQQKPSKSSLPPLEPENKDFFNFLICPQRNCSAF